MSLSWVRHRAASAALALCAGAALPLLASPAYAEPTESGREVVFRGGGVLGLSCGADPSTSSVTVRAKSTLRVVNRTGHRATLVLDGTPRGEIADRKAAEVLFHRGPVNLGLRPHCVLSEKSSPVRVHVVAAAPSPSDPPPVPRTPSVPPPRDSGGADYPTAPATRGPGRSTGTPARPAPDDQPGGPDSGAGGVLAPPAEPGASAGPGAEDIVEPPVDSGTGAGATAAPDAGEGLAAEPMASVEPLTNKGPTGLLAIIAVVCIIGVAAGAIRAILAQRVSRTGMA